MVSWLVRINNAKIVCLPILTSASFAFSMVSMKEGRSIKRREEEVKASAEKKETKRDIGERERETQRQLIFHWLPISDW